MVERLGKWLYCFFTLGTLAILYGQVKAIRNVERAFLIPVWRDEIWLHPEWVNKGEMRHCFLWRFKNEGKTPAFLREIYGNIAIYGTEDTIPQIRPTLRRRSRFTKENRSQLAP